MCTTCLLLVFVAAFINVLTGALMLAILVRVILSWVPHVRLPFGIGEFAFGVSEPILGPLRRALPMAGGLDFSPFLALIALQWIKGLLLGFLAQVG